MQIDVIIPCYNYGRYLRGCVESVLAQPDVDVRVLIIDDCSPDHTPEVGRALSLEDPRIEYRRHATNQRHIATYNEGFQWVRGDAALLLSADDLLTPGSLARVAEVLEQRADVGMFWGRQIVFADVAPAASPTLNWTHKVVAGRELIDQICRTGSNPITTPTAVVRTCVLKAIGGYDPALPHTADMQYWLRCAARSSIALIDADQAYKRMHGENMQVEFVTRIIPDLEHRLAAVAAFLRADEGLVADPKHLLALAAQAVANEALWSASRAFESGAADQCDELLAFAREHDPRLPLGRAWSRLAWKRRLGSRVWRAVRPLVDGLRKQPATAKTNCGK